VAGTEKAEGRRARTSPRLARTLGGSAALLAILERVLSPRRVIA
jgi:hypothetical protein